MNKFLDLLYFHRFNLILLLIIFGSIIVNIVLYYITHFEKTITIKDKYTSITFKIYEWKGAGDSPVKT